MKNLIMGVLATVLLTACDTGPTSGIGFTLPDGDAERGKEVFVSLECNACHYIGDVKQSPEPEEGGLSIMLGGKVGTIKTYGQLVTSVINPSHKIIRHYPRDKVATTDGESRMRLYNDVMTINQLIDIVAFLQSNYTLQPYEPTRYRIYHP